MANRSRARTVARPFGGASLAVLLAAVLTMFGVAPASAEGSASISGVVTNTRGEPLPGSAVSLFLPNDSSILMVLARAKTDEQGAFAFTGLAAGDYGVHVYGPESTEYLGETWDDAGSWHTPTVISLADGEARADIEMQLAIGGVVTGVIADESGAPVPGAFVQFQRYDKHPDPSGQTEWSTTTDASGSYEIRRMDPGRYVPRILASNSTGSAAYGYVTLQMDPIDVAVDAVTDLDATLTSASVIEGTVTDSQGDPVRFLNVTLWALRDGRWSQVADTQTGWNDANIGQFRFRGLASGLYTLWFWSSSDDDYVAQYWNEKPAQWGLADPERASADPIELGTGQSMTADVRIADGARIHGTVTDDAGVPIQSRRVTVYLARQDSWTAFGSAYTGSDGTYDFGRMPAGTYTVEFPASNGAGGEWWEDAPSQEAARVIEVTEGEVASGIDAELSRGLVSLSPPIVSGSASVGSTLTAAATSRTPGVAFTYEWLADGSSFAEASGTSVEIGPGQIGAAISVRVTASAPGYTPSSMDSSPTGPVVPGTLASDMPSISGTAVMGSRLTVHPGVWSDNTSFTYQWFANGEAIDGATRPTLKLSLLNVDTSIAVRVTGAKPGFTPASMTSAQTPKVLLRLLPPTGTHRRPVELMHRTAATDAG